jgi:streptogramin lyase
MLSCAGVTSGGEAEVSPDARSADSRMQVGTIEQILLPGSGYVFDVAVGEGAVWVTSHVGLYRIDPASGEATNVLPHDYLFRVATGHDSVWLTTGGDGRVLRFDPATNEITVEMVLHDGPVTSLAISPDGVWVSASTSLERIDPTTNDVTARVRHQGSFGEIAFGEGDLWAVAGAGRDGEVWQIDGATAEIEREIPVENPSFWNEIDAEAGSIWVTTSPVARGSGEPLVRLYRIDPSTGHVTGAVPLGESPPGGSVSYSSLTADEETVWVQVEFDSTVARIDPESLDVQETLQGIEGFSGDTGSAVASGAGALWVTAPEAITRIEMIEAER